LISPGFDEEGNRKDFAFDKDGESKIRRFWNPRMEAWWTKSDLGKYKSLAALDEEKQRKLT
jgi:hypothetical protein